MKSMFPLPIMYRRKLTCQSVWYTPGYQFCCGTCKRLLFRPKIVRYCTYIYTVYSIPNSQFRHPVNQSWIILAEKDSMPVDNKKVTNWTVNVWRDCSENQKKTYSVADEFPPHNFISQESELNNWLFQFMLTQSLQYRLEKHLSKDFHQLCCGILHYIACKFYVILHADYLYIIR